MNTKYVIDRLANVLDSYPPRKYKHLFDRSCGRLSLEKQIKKERLCVSLNRIISKTILNLSLQPNVSLIMKNKTI